MTRHVRGLQRPHILRVSAAVAAACLTLLGAPSATWAQGGPAGVEQRTWLQLEATSARIRSVSQSYDFFDDTIGQPVDTENTLGAPRRGTAWGLSFGRRIGEAWRIEAAFSQEGRDGRAVLAQDTNVEGTVYASGSTLRSTTQMRTWRVQGGYSFLQSGTAEAGISLGGHGLRLRRDLSGTPAGSAPGTVVSDFGRDSVVLPLVGLYGTLALAPAWQLSGRVDLTPGEDHAAAAATLLWRATPHLAIGLGYQVMETNLDVTWGFVFVERTVVDYRRHGPTLSVLLGF